MLAYRLWLDPALPPALGDGDTTRALSTLGGAMTVAGEVGGQAGALIGDTARTAFTDAMRAIAVFGMAMMLLAAWMAARLMRDGEGAGHAAPTADAPADA